MSGFWIRIVNVCAVCALLIGYNFVIDDRQAKEEAAYQEAFAQVEELKAQYGISDIEDEEVATSSNADGGYKDGSYEGQADGFGGPIKVSVTVKDGAIASIDIVEAKSEDSAYLSIATDIVDDIIEQQTPQVDTISGATFSSTGIKNAVENALEGAK